MESDPQSQLPKSVKNAPRRSKNYVGEEFIPPDGGWGWIVALASGASILVTYPITQQFGITFRERFEELQLSYAQMATIINTQQCVSAFVGLFSGPLLHYFTFRQVGFLGAFATFLGLFLGIFMETFLYYVITISITYGIGRGLMLCASTLAVNTYFKRKRTTAIACEFSVAGLGPIIYPFLSTYLMTLYDINGVMLIYSGIALHNFACAMVYQPVKWHVKKKVHPQLADHATSARKYEFSKWGQRISLQGAVRTLTMELTQPNEIPYTFCYRIVQFFQLHLLKDFTFFNMLLGLTVISFVEVNFNALVPFILSDYNFNQTQIADAMSLLAACDMVIRFIIVALSKKIKMNNKACLLTAVFGICCGRIVVAHFRNPNIVLIAFGWMGLCKAIKTVFWNLILPNYVPLNDLPAAFGLLLFMLGVFALACGPILGFVQDTTNQTFTLHFLNGLCFIVIISWCLEGLFKKQTDEQVQNGQPRTSNIKPK